MGNNNYKKYKFYTPPCDIYNAYKVGVFEIKEVENKTIPITTGRGSATVIEKKKASDYARVYDSYGGVIYLKKRERKRERKVRFGEKSNLVSENNPNLASVDFDSENLNPISTFERQGEREKRGIKGISEASNEVKYNVVGDEGSFAYENERGLSEGNGGEAKGENNGYVGGYNIGYSGDENGVKFGGNGYENDSKISSSGCENGREISYSGYGIRGEDDVVNHSKHDDSAKYGESFSNRRIIQDERSKRGKGDRHATSGYDKTKRRRKNRQDGKIGGYGGFGDGRGGGFGGKGGYGNGGSNGYGYYEQNKKPKKISRSGALLIGLFMVAVFVVTFFACNFYIPNSWHKGEGDKFYFAVGKTAVNYEDARQIANSYKSKGGAGYIMEEDLFVIADVYKSESDAEKVINNPSNKNAFTEIKTLKEREYCYDYVDKTMLMVISSSLSYVDIAFYDLKAISTGYSQKETDEKEAKSRIVKVSNKLKQIKDTFDDNAVGVSNDKVLKLKAQLGVSYKITSDLSREGNLASSIRYAYTSILILHIALVEDSYLKK